MARSHAVDAARAAVPEPLAMGVARPSGPARERAVSSQLTRLVALVAVGAVALRFTIFSDVTLGLVIGLGLAPVWLGRLRLYRGAAVFVGLVVAAVLSGVWLTMAAAADHTIAVHSLRLWLILMLTLAVGVGVVLWARTLVDDSVVAMVFGVGLLLGSVLGGQAAANPWKGTYSIPLTLILLGWAWRRRSRVLEVVLALGLAGVSALNDSRSHFAMLLVAVTAVLWQVWVRSGDGRASAWRSMLLLPVVVLAVYSFGQSLILDGYLGQATQARSEAQVREAGSLLLGARPELGATLALVQDRPWGFGMGTQATPDEVLVAKEGMARLNYSPNNGYVEKYMFGDIVEVHSLAGDAWALFGIPGAVLIAFVAWTMLRRFGQALSERTLSALMAFLIARVLWDTAFGPLYSDLPILAIAVGLALLRRPATTSAPA